MSEHRSELFRDATGGSEPIPQTGEPAVDRALESLQGLESSSLNDQYDRLAGVHEELHRALNTEPAGDA